MCPQSKDKYTDMSLKYGQIAGGQIIQNKTINFVQFDEQNPLTYSCIIR